MNIKSISVLICVGVASACLANAQEASPAESPAPSASPAKHHHKKAEATTAASPEASAAEASPSPAKRAKKTKATTEASPAASASASPAEKKHKTKATAAASTAVTPSPSPKKTLADFFKSKSSPTPAGSVAPGKTSTKGETVANATPAPGGGHGMVWVNTETHVYHKEGSRFYGKTKQGKYVSEADAVKEGDRAAKTGE